jgi:flagellar motor switch protein FliG
MSDLEKRTLPQPFLNGRQLASQMISQLSLQEKKNILYKMSLKNPIMAKELRRQSFTFEEIYTFSDEQLVSIVRFVEPIVAGIAFRLASEEFKKRFLKLCTREYAEKAFEYMVKSKQVSMQDIKRAQSKLLEMISPFVELLYS